MAKVDMSLTLNAPAEKIWDVIGGFNALARWHPAVQRSEETAEGGKTRRKLSLAGGGEIIEELERRDDKTHAYSYRIVSGPLPVSGYRSELRVADQGGGRSTVHWSSTFEPSGAEADAIAAVRGVYQAGFDSLKKQFGG
ncbi:MAG TPA: SRPBCC family protein [Stellaceae bacterium]|nr:SRPBCC family protein [Stellaceae bacterium]